MNHWEHSTDDSGLAEVRVLTTTLLVYLGLRRASSEATIHDV